jgi:hypothetical protein
LNHVAEAVGKDQSVEVPDTALGRVNEAIVLDFDKLTEEFDGGV